MSFQAPHHFTAHLQLPRDAPPPTGDNSSQGVSDGSVTAHTMFSTSSNPMGQCRHQTTSPLHNYYICSEFHGRGQGPVSWESELPTVFDFKTTPRGRTMSGFVTFQTSPESSPEDFLVYMAHIQPAWKH